MLSRVVEVVKDRTAMVDADIARLSMNELKTWNVILRR
jgi:hypothetical protein